MGLETEPRTEPRVVLEKMVGSGLIKIVLAADTIPELNSAETKKFACEMAARSGLSPPAIRSGGAPYPVNENGEATNEVAFGQEPRLEYRVDFEIGRGITP